MASARGATDEEDELRFVVLKGDLAVTVNAVTRIIRPGPQTTIRIRRTHSRGRGGPHGRHEAPTFAPKALRRASGVGSRRQAGRPGALDAPTATF